MRVESSDGVQVAVHEFGGTGRPLLWSHATGFHAHCYEPIARRLSNDFTSFGLDHRGHGVTGASTSEVAEGQLDWYGYGRDARVAAEAIAPDGGLVAFGHSMGGASLVMAAHANPTLFETLVVFEPIVFPTPDAEPADEPSPMVAAARNRRPTFDSYQAAIDNYASKPPMKFFDPEVLRAYVEHGFAPVSDDDGDSSVTLRCTPEHEARTFETGGTHGFWDLLPEVETRVVVVSGEVDEKRSPAGIAAGIAERLPNGSSVELAGGNHLTPFTDPEAIVRLLREHLG